MKKMFSIIVVSASLVGISIAALSNPAFAEERKRNWYDTSSTIATGTEIDFIQKRAIILEGRFLKAILGAAEIGALYASDVKILQNKMQVINDCGKEYVKYSHDFLELEEAKVKSFDDCLTSYKYPRLEKKDAELQGFEDKWSKYKIDERRLGSLQFWRDLTTVDVPHPLLVIAKLAAEIGIFSITDTEDEKYRQGFKLQVMDGIRLMLNKNSEGAASYNQKMETILKDLATLYQSHARFEKDQEIYEQEEKKNSNNGIKRGDLVMLGKHLHVAMLAEDKAIVLETEEQTKLGMLMANELYKMYTCLLSLQKANTDSLGNDCHIPSVRERMQLGTKVANKYEDFMKNGGLKNANKDDMGDIDMKIDTVVKLISLYQTTATQGEQQEARKTQIRTKAINPLLEYIETDIKDPTRE
jgi:hypothetical protein